MNKDPWGSFQNFMGDFRQLAQNPAQFMQQRYGISNANDPDAILQDLMNSGKLSQEDYNKARQAAMRIQNNPMFGQFMRGFKR